MKTYKCFVNKILKQSFLFNKIYCISNKDLDLLKTYIQKNNLPFIINSHVYKNISYFEFEKYLQPKNKK